MEVLMESNHLAAVCSAHGLQPEGFLCFGSQSC